MASWTRWTTNYEMWRRWTERWTRYILKSLLLDVLYLLDILSSVLHPFSPVFYWIVKRRCFILHSGSWLVTFFYLFSRTLVWVIIYPIYSSVLLYTIYVNCPAQDRPVSAPEKPESDSKLNTQRGIRHGIVDLRERTWWKHGPFLPNLSWGACREDNKYIFPYVCGPYLARQGYP